MAFNFPDGASSGDTHTASNGTVYRYNGTTWLVDSATTTSTFDSRYLNTTGDGIVSGSITDQLPSGVVSGSAQSVAHITGADLDMGGNKVLFGNVYSTEGDLPNAGTYHGMFAHVHGTGRGYFAHGGAWYPLVNLSDGVLSGSLQAQLPSGTISSSAQMTSLGFISESSVNTSLNTFTSSIQTQVNTLSAATGSYLTSSGSVDYSDLTSVPSNIVSGSSQLDGYVSSSNANIIQVITSASYATITPVSGTLYIIQG